MTINPDLLICAPVLQDYLVNKDGTPLSGGIVTLWVDTQRYIELKNWYYQVNTGGVYTYIPLDNPLSLSAAGTIQDPNGNDVIPFYYPFDEVNENIREAYFITVYDVDSDGNPAVLQFTRENFPFVGTGEQPTEQNATLKNYIVNNSFWRNIGSANLANVNSMIVAPSQHDGYTTNSDIQFIKDVTGAADSITFNQMTSSLTNDTTPEFYLNMMCTGNLQSETVKCIQYPVSLHVTQLQNVAATLTIQAQNVSGSPNNFLDVYIYQYLGFGAISQPPPVLIQRIFLNSNFQKFVLPFIFPNFNNPPTGLVSGVGGDDAWFIRIQYPLNATFNINHTKASVYLSNEVPTNDFDTYDQVGAIFDSSRTGDYRISLNPFQPYGWVAANDGTIGTPTSGATARANFDTWPLYNLIYTSVLNNWAPVTGGRTSPGNTTTAAYADFSANKPIKLTRQLGRVIAGLNGAVAPIVFTTNYTASHFNLTVSSSTNLLTGSPVQLTNTGGALPSSLAVNTLYFIININATTVQLASSIENAYAATPIDIGSDQTGTSTILDALGIYTGTSTQTLVAGNLPPHAHGTTGSGPNFVTSSGTSNFLSSTGAQNVGQCATTDNGPGSSTPFSIFQPTVYSNVFFKL